MAIDRPKVLYPNQQTNIDPTEILKIEWRALSPQTDYEVNVYKASDNSNIYASGKITSVNLYHDIPINTLNSYTNENLYVNVKVYFNTLENVSFNESFQVNYIPTFTINSYPALIPTEKYTFNFTYSQTDDILYKAWKFKLYDTASNLISDSGYFYADDTNVNIYQQQYEVTNLGRGNSYKIEFECITKVDQTVSTGLQDIAIDEFHIYPETPNIDAIPDDKNGNILLNYEKLKVIQATTSGTTSFNSDGKFNQCIEIQDEVSYVEIAEEIPKDCTLLWYFKFPHNFSGKMMTIQDDGGDVEVGYENNKFYYKNTDGAKFETDLIAPFTSNDFSGFQLNPYLGAQMTAMDGNYMGNWAFCVLTNNRLYIKLDTPIINQIVDWEIDLKYTSNHSNIRFYGKQLIDHAQAFSKAYTVTEMDAIDINVATVWDVYTEYLAKFDNNLEVGNVAGGESFVGYRFKRVNVSTGLTKTIAELVPKDTLTRTLKDSTTVNNTLYKYGIYVVNANGESVVQLSEEVQNNFFGSFLISQDSETIYHFNSGFGTGLQLNEITQNTQQAIYENNDQFPIVANGVMNYASSGLTAFIEEYDEDGCIIPINVDKVNALKGFITNGQTKIYKDYMKNIYLVTTNSFSRAIASNEGIQVYKSVSFQWVQVGEV